MDERVFLLQAKHGRESGTVALPKRYQPDQVEIDLQSKWQAEGVHHFAGDGSRPVFAIDTPPPTVSGHLHLGHVYSYSQADFIARYRRMAGDDVLYPMGYDDNGLPTERLVERELGIHAVDVGRQAFIEKCLEISEVAERDYRQLWQRLGLSIDWRHTYRTIDENTRRLSQRSFLDLYRRGLAYRRQAPAIWCPECQTAIAQAELDDLDRESEYVTLAFTLEDGTSLPIATTRPELLPACVAIFVHPDDHRYAGLIGRTATVPLFNRSVVIWADPAAEREKGTGAVMCCTFGDTTDVAWWYTYDLDLVEAIGRDGRLTDAAGEYAGLDTTRARARIKEDLAKAGYLTGRRATTQSLRVHERCDTPVEYVVAHQWFVRVLEHKEALLAAGRAVDWRPAHMQSRYQQWVENLNWDWCISRQRYFGVTFPIWYCDSCGQVIAADPDALPVDPSEMAPDGPCDCGGTHFTPERDVMDTWATSSLTPQLIGQILGRSGFDGQPFEPVSLR
ncbi:MAG: class I tRNA ligase family protein, partial [Chloroflexota bacterium]